MNSSQPDRVEVSTQRVGRRSRRSPPDPDRLVHDVIVRAEAAGRAPAVIGYHRIDGPGSSLSLPLFQLSFFRQPQLPTDLRRDPSWAWSKGLPRTIAWTITTGTKITARPFMLGKLAMEIQHGGHARRTVGTIGNIAPLRQNWILKIMEAFGLNGVMFSFKDIDPRTRSGGLGGSATATTSAVLLADHLTGGTMGRSQIVAMASGYETHLGVSLTGRQEQWNVVAGGVTDYVWFPWGRPAEGTDCGETAMRKLLPVDAVGELLRRCALVRAGEQRASTDVNRVWMRRMRTKAGFELHKLKPGLAYQYAEALRNHEWESVTQVIESYRVIRTRLCPEYMDGAQWLHAIARDHDATIFPLGAGGGGFSLVWSAHAEAIERIKSRLLNDVSDRVMEFDIRDRGHEFVNPIDMPDRP